MSFLTQIAVFLAAAVIAVPIFRRFGLGAILGYLAAGVVIGPSVLGLVTDVTDVLHFGEIGVVFLLFIIGLEVQPARLRVMRRTVFLPGALQVGISAVLLAGAGYALGLDPRAAVAVGLALSLSSTAFVLQMFAERQTLKTRHGRAGFGVLLFQDLAVVPMIAILPVLAPGAGDVPLTELLLKVGGTTAAVAAFVFGGHFLLRPLLRAVASAGTKEVFTAAALLLVLGSAVLMDSLGISMALGAFVAGVLVADSEYRHQLEADIEPFKGLLLGLFFMAVGMNANLALAWEQPLAVVALATGLITVKALVLYGVARVQRLPHADALRVGFSLAQGGEFAFVLLGAAAGRAILPGDTTDLITVVVTLSMAATPLLASLAEWLLSRQRDQRPYDHLEDEREHDVVIAGFGRFGQIIGRLLSSQGIPFTALEANPTQVDFVRRFGNRIFYGDASRLDILRAAGTARARVFVLAVDDVEASMRIAELLATHFPRVRVYARARNRHHAHRLMAVGCTRLVREEYLSSLWLGGEVLQGLGMSEADALTAAELFRTHDERTLREQYAIRDDRDALVQSAQDAAAELRQLFEADASRRN